MKIQVELNLEDVFDEAIYNEVTLKEEFTRSVRLDVIRELKEKFKNELMGKYPIRYQESLRI